MFIPQESRAYSLCGTRYAINEQFTLFFENIDNDMFLILYKSLIRPHLEYGSQVLSTINKKEQTTLENIQRRATRLLPKKSKLQYHERLKILGLSSLQYRRLRSDMIQVFVYA